MMSVMRSFPDDAMLSWSPNAPISPVLIVEGGRTGHFLKRGSIPEPSPLSKFWRNGPFCLLELERFWRNE